MIAYAATVARAPVEKLCFTAVKAAARTSIEIDNDKWSVGAVAIATGARDSCWSLPRRLPSDCRRGGGGGLFVGVSPPHHYWPACRLAITTF